MRVVLISDTHGMLPQDVPDSDILIHAGDIGPDRNAEVWFATTFADWCHRLDRPIYITFGNHDFIGETPPVAGIPDNVGILVDYCWTLPNGTIAYFTPFVTNLPMWAFNRTEDDLVQIYADIPDDVQLIVSHAPPHGTLDYLEGWGHVGGTALRDRLMTHPSVSKVVCGHIHEGYGQALLERPNMPSIEVYNVAHCDVDYQPVNPPMVIDL